jgi:hypothetical protein
MMEEAGSMLQSMPRGDEPPKVETVSTHVLVPEDQADLLRDLSRRTRVAQSEYLREAVEDLLSKYGRPREDGVHPAQAAA